MDVDSERYVEAVADAIRAVVGDRLAGAYLHGSAALGGFDARRSDLDILAVVSGSIPAADKTTLATALSATALPCPAAGLELSVVTVGTAQHPMARPPFDLHVTTAPADSNVIDGNGHPGDPDLVLHFAVCRQSGRLIGDGLPREEAFAHVDPSLVLAQLADELQWGLVNAPAEYGVLNACRALKFAADRLLVSKVDGGEWMLGHARWPHAAGLITSALSHQRCLPAPDLRVADVRSFVEAAVTQLRQQSASETLR